MGSWSRTACAPHDEPRDESLAHARRARAGADTRTTRRRLVLSMSSIAIGVAALVAVDSYSADVVRSIHVQARSLLGADLSVSARRTLPAPALAWLDSLRARGASETHVTTFSSMAVGGSLAAAARARGSCRCARWGQARRSTERSRRRRPTNGRSSRAGRSPSSTRRCSIALDAKIGDTLSLGYARFAIIATLRNVPGDVGIASALGPRVYIPDRYLAATQLLTYGSRAEYETLVRFPPAMDADALAKSHRELFDSLQVRARSVADTERSLTRSIEQLGPIPRARGTHRAPARRHGRGERASRVHGGEDRCDRGVCAVSARARARWCRMFVIEAAGLGLAGAVMGVVLGVAAQLVLPHVLGSFIPVDVAPQLEWIADARAGSRSAPGWACSSRSDPCSACETSRRCRCSAAMTTAPRRSAAIGMARSAAQSSRRWCSPRAWSRSASRARTARSWGSG